MRGIDSEIELSRLCSEVAKYGEVGSYRRQDDSIKPLFVVGSPRSGTTVMGRCLGAHPKASTDEESFFLLHLWHIFSDLYRGENWREWSPLGEYLEEDQLIEAMGTFADKIFKSLLDKKKGAELYVDHTPWYASIAPFIDKLYPEAKYIHMIRDGRSVTRSLNVSGSNGFSWAGTTVRDSATLWVQMVDRAKCIGSGSPDRYIEVRYEDYVKKPEENLKRVSDFVGLDFAKEMLLPMQDSHSGPSRSPKEVFSRSTEVKKPGWPNHWSSRERKDFLEVTRHTMRSLGYFAD